ncbi:hypothetical protein FW774_18305 [Pedobacter sp. BS3]|uniref:hypothetical protein n=1 Tax=Pedobacter sp. BS3 TaxID=2567937 RepID=UPI0011EE847E|nr:hypothetical protein [Pedobacter sp. BS3]TZF81506.1 hypothetical protein FW774_18305 [Pedobacter sp. BS3]
MRTYLLLAILFTMCSVSAFAQQHAEGEKYIRQLDLYQDSLNALSYKMINDPIDPQRFNANYAFTRMLVKALKTPHSFNYNFDSLKTISIVTPPDRRFRILTWHVMYDDGSYRYYGCIQKNNPDGKLDMFGMVDYTPKIKDPADTVTSNDRWYGAQYYSIVPVLYNTPIQYYVLLGWKGNTAKSTKKVIDVLYFKNGKPVFGMPVFEKTTAKRIIFEYTRQASMLLKYDAKTNMIVFDHLAPPDPKQKDNFAMYGPDFTYDGYKLFNGRWKHLSDLPLKNEPTDTDKDFNDPKNPQRKISRKF